MTEQTQNATHIEEMFSAGAHFGYSRSRRHPSVKPYLYGAKNGVEIIDLESTASQLEDAKTFMETLGKEGKTVLFIGTKNEGHEAVQTTAEALGQPYVTYRWVGGTLTNFPEIKKRIQKLNELTESREKGDLSKRYTKKELLLIDREIEDLQKNFGGLSDMEKLPDAVFVLDIGFEDIATKEAQRMNIPVITLSNSDCDINSVEHPILANDNSVPSIQFFLTQLKEAFEAGRKAMKTEAPKEEEKTA